MDRGAEIAAIGERARRDLAEKHAAREVTLAASRRTIQSVRVGDPRGAPRGVRAAPRSYRRGVGRRSKKPTQAVVAHPDIRHGGYLADAKKEYAEACLTLAFVRGDPIPTPEAIHVDVPPYLNGLAEAASELRRLTLDCLRADRLDRAEELLGIMDDVYSLLVDRRLPRRRSRAGCAARPTRCGR